MASVGDKYQLGERIGGGGMADVFRAVIRGAEGFERPVAIKRIKQNISTDKDFAKLFVAEARLAARLSHPNVVQTIDFDRDDTGCFYLVMELIEGVDLRQLVLSGRVPVTAVVFIIAEVLRALDYAHEMVADGHPITIVHRDISPHNIMLGWQGGVKVVDFGIAKAIAGSLISRSGSLKGKVAYMSPEQVHGQALDGRSDLFAVGIMLHELLTGERLFIAPTEAATLSQVLTKPILRPKSRNDQVPDDLDAIAMRLLERDRDARFERARDALEALASCSVGISQGRLDLETVLGERFPTQVPKRVRRLSNGPGSSARIQQIASVNDGASGTDETLAATPKAMPAPALTSRRTETAMPVSRVSADYDKAPDILEVERALPRSRKTLWAGLVALVGLSLVGFVALTRDAQETPKTPRVEVLSVASGVESVTEPAAAWGSAEPKAARDAGTMGSADSGADGLRTRDAGPSQQPNTVTRHPSPVAVAKVKAKLTVSVKPWARIIIDGKSYGQTPQTIELTRGKHRIVLKNDGLDRSEKVSIDLDAGEVKVIDLNWLGD